VFHGSFDFDSTLSRMNTVVCSFCGESVKGKAPAEIVVPLEDGGQQKLWAHTACLTAGVRREVPTLLTSHASQAHALTSDQAYIAMFTFLEKQWELSRSEELGALLGSLSLLSDGTPADPALGTDWATSVAAALKGDASAAMKLDNM
jgi:hypothetical protein